MLTAKEREKEADAEKKEGSNLEGAAADWETIGNSYAEQGEGGDFECCYLCEAARAYGRAAQDFRKDAARATKQADKDFDNKQADADFAKAAMLFLKCGDLCFESAEFTCALAGYAQAEAYYAAIEKKAKAAGDTDTENDAKKKREHATSASAKIEEFKKKLQEEQSKKLKSK